jgi:DsbC/DsbD-like thiol-disulfide interchange protein
MPDGTLQAAVEIRLKPGWHTYWRYPGDAGVPPRLDFAASGNLGSVQVSWPAPQRLPEGDLVVIGYAGDVVLPLSVAPQSRGQPVDLRLKLDYAICEKLCVPVEAEVRLRLDGSRSAHDGVIAAALARVPRRAAIGVPGPLAIMAVRREEAAGRVVVDVSGPSSPPAVLFAEGPTPDWALPVPRAIQGAPAGLQRFAFALEGAPPGAELKGAAITLTAVAGKAATETVVHLD